MTRKERQQKRNAELTAGYRAYLRSRMPRGIEIDNWLNLGGVVERALKRMVWQEVRDEIRKTNEVRQKSE